MQRKKVEENANASFLRETRNNRPSSRGNHDFRSMPAIRYEATDGKLSCQTQRAPCM